MIGNVGLSGAGPAHFRKSKILCRISKFIILKKFCGLTEKICMPVDTVGHTVESGLVFQLGNIQFNKNVTFTSNFLVLSASFLSVNAGILLIIFLPTKFNKHGISKLSVVGVFERNRQKLKRRQLDTTP